MDVGVLGSFEASENGVSLLPTAGKPRQLLALMALHAGQVVQVPTLMDELWGMDPPRSAQTTLQTYILQLRRRIAGVLPAGGPRTPKDVLATRYGGYLLDISPEDVDVHTYERQAAAGRRALHLGDLETASRLLRSALGTWRGRPLADVQAGMRLSVEVTRLEESRLCTVETRVEADLALGRHHALLSELAVLTARHPLHENLCGQHMVALYRSGQQWRALEAFARLRGTLVEELGVEPSQRLQALQRAVLCSDPELDRFAVRAELAV
ncbi:AfsR/SARP family transcriptional regulator [Streptomyces sp. DSM 42041]|uniref:AfsR/SARP family transcriptional regulator n=1 Tax=Streptomyces hazeniae TaxID=3075538 RepID=A0ABU2NNB4_9ACTN|nr:AfsR/SARP family transcriptional regulator [Streptomyces sp. DSM 42041]MDT0378451.1 AfsR/SARP family transcriptional regulator [Streptomyces sp. DSM 42041]